MMKVWNILFSKELNEQGSDKNELDYEDKWKSEKGGWLYIEDSQQDLYPMKANLYGI